MQQLNARMDKLDETVQQGLCDVAEFVMEETNEMRKMIAQLLVTQRELLRNATSSSQHFHYETSLEPTVIEHTGVTDNNSAITMSRVGFFGVRKKQ